MHSLIAKTRHTIAGLLLLLLPAMGGLLLSLPAPARAQDKIRITRSDQLPSTLFPVTGSPSVILTSGDAFDVLAQALRRDLEDILTRYDIVDIDVLQATYNTLQGIALIEGRYDDAMALVGRIRELETREAQKLTTGMVAHALAEASRSSGESPGSTGFSAAFRDAYGERVAALPWDVVGQDLEGVHAQMQILSESVLVGVIQGQLDPVAAETGSLTRDQASQVVNFRAAVDVVIPVKEDIAAVLAEAMDSHRRTVVDIWPARQMDLAPDAGRPPVIVAVWSTGVDISLFEGRLQTNPAETYDGADTDGNGFVDDVNGIAFDGDHQPVPELLLPLDVDSARRRELEGLAQGFSDLQSGVSSPAATDLRRHLSSLPAEDVNRFASELSLYTQHAFGTHAAGLVAQGNPFVRILPARMTFDYQSVPRTASGSMARAWGAEIRGTVEYCKSRHVRVVSLDWVVAVQELEALLEINGVGRNAADRQGVAREIFGVIRADLDAAIAGAPEIVFVANASAFGGGGGLDGLLPGALEHPNLLVAGVVDVAGEPAGYTLTGTTAPVYAKGVEVESVVPGGARIALSGALLGAPQVANLAAKLLAVSPGLEPAEVIALIREGADFLGEDPRLAVINPRQTLAGTTGSR